MNPHPTPTPDEIAAAKAAHNRVMESEGSIRRETFSVRVAERKTCREEIARDLATANAPLHAEVEKLGHIILGLGQEKVALLAEVKALKAWKESALTIINKIDLQSVGNALGLRLGEDVAPAILHGIWVLNGKVDAFKKERDRLQQENQALRKQVKAGEEVVCALKELHAAMSNSAGVAERNANGLLAAKLKFFISHPRAIAALAQWEEAKK